MVAENSITHYTYKRYLGNGRVQRRKLANYSTIIPINILKHDFLL